MFKKILERFKKKNTKLKSKKDTPSTNQSNINLLHHTTNNIHQDDYHNHKCGDNDCGLEHSTSYDHGTHECSSHDYNHSFDCDCGD